MSLRAPRRGRPPKAGAEPLSFEALNRRRSELWSVSLFSVAALTVAVGIFSLGRDMLPETLRFESFSNWIVLVLLGGLLLSFILYVAEKEKSLRRISHQLFEEKIRTERLSQRLRETAKLSRVGRAMNATLDLPVVLDMILDQALELLGGQEASIMLLDPEGGFLEVVSYRGAAADAVLGARMPLGEGIAGVVAEQRQPLLLQQSPGPPVEGAGHEERSINSAMSCPLVRRDELLGVLNITETAGLHGFNPSDLDALGFFAEHAAIALGNARLFAKERETIERLEELDRLKSDFLANVSHELRSPLASIIGSARTIKRSGSRMPAHEMENFIDVIDRQGGRLLSLVEELLTSSKVDSGRFKVRRVKVEIGPFLDQLVNDMCASQLGEPRKVMIELRSNDPVVWCDDRALNHIVRNLIDNAIKYSEEGTTVHVSAEKTPSEVVFTFSDEGRGIPEEMMEHIFERFRQLDPSNTRAVGGVGLGLSIVKALVDVHNGSIEVESEVGKGSTFTVRIPQRSPDRDQPVGVSAANPV